MNISDSSRRALASAQRRDDELTKPLHVQIEKLQRELAASEARVEEAVAFGVRWMVEYETRGKGTIEQDTVSEAVAAWRSQHAAFTVPGTVSVTGKDATFTPAPIGGGDGCKDTTWRDANHEDPAEA